MTGYQSVALAVVMLAIMVYAATRPAPNVIETHHHVMVLKQLAANMWLMKDDEQGEFRYTGCADFPNDKVIWPGYVADHAVWEEQGGCKSIRRVGLGFFWEHDDKGNVVEIYRASGSE